MIAVVVVAVVLAVACVALGVLLVRARAGVKRTQGELEAAQASGAKKGEELEAAQGELAEARGSAQAAAEQAAGARSEAEAARAEAQAQLTEAAGARADADAARAELSASRGALGEGGAGGGAAGGVGGLGEGGATAPTLGALWSLARVRQEWANRQASSLTLDDVHLEGSWTEVSLAEVLDEEVSRLREETGTPGALRTALHDEPPAGQSMLLLAGVQALLEALARHCQGYDLYVHHWEQRLSAIVVCEGFDGPDQVAGDTEAVLSAIAPAGGELELDRDPQGRLRARLSLPLASAVD